MERVQNLKSKSDGELQVKVDYDDYSLRAQSDGEKCSSKGDVFSEQDEVQKEVLQETTRIAYTMKKYVKPSYELYLSTFRPVNCPMPACGTMTCPSALLMHLQQCHRDLPSSELDLTGTTSSFDVYERLCKLQPLIPTPIHLFKVNDGMYPEFPIMLQMCWLSEEEEPALTSDRWLAAWLSCLYIIPMWFKIQFVSYSPRQTATTYVCKATEMKRSKMTAKEIAENNDIMLIQEQALAQLYSNELTVYVEVNAYTIRYTPKNVVPALNELGKNVVPESI